MRESYNDGVTEWGLHAVLPQYNFFVTGCCVRRHLQFATFSLVNNNQWSVQHLSVPGMECVMRTSLQRAMVVVQRDAKFRSKVHPHRLLSARELKDNICEELMLSTHARREFIDIAVFIASLSNN